MRNKHNNIKIKIEETREELYILVRKIGNIKNKEIVEKSKELDQLLNEFLINISSNT